MTVDWNLVALAVVIGLIWSAVLIVATRKISRPETLYLAGRIRSGFGTQVIWDVIGIFTHREKAVAACRDKDDFFFPLRPDQKQEDPERAPLAFPAREEKG